MNMIGLSRELSKVKGELKHAKEECAYYKVRCEYQENETLVTMMAMTEVFEMVLMQSPMALNSKNRKVDTTMVEVYVTLILKGKKTVEQVPTVIRPRVEAMLKELGVNAE